MDSFGTPGSGRTRSVQVGGAGTAGKFRSDGDLGSRSELQLFMWGGGFSDRRPGFAGSQCERWRTDAEHLSFRHVHCPRQSDGCGGNSSGLGNTDTRTLRAFHHELGWRFFEPASGWRKRLTAFVNSAVRVERGHHDSSVATLRRKGPRNRLHSGGSHPREGETAPRTCEEIEFGPVISGKSLLNCLGSLQIVLLDL
jgi:hypothetical protein